MKPFTTDFSDVSSTIMIRWKVLPNYSKSPMTFITRTIIMMHGAAVICANPKMYSFFIIT